MKRICTLILLLTFVGNSIWSQDGKTQNRPYIDQRRFHYGFSVGMNMLDYEFANTGATTATGEQWYADVPSYSPGFSVGILGELYLTKHLALRMIPTLHFGTRTVRFQDYSQQAMREVQNVKTTYLALPLDLKISGTRYLNYRPYVMTGISPVYDLNVKKGGMIRVKPTDCFLEVGLGCDYYFPFFKFIPELKFCFGLSNLLEKNRNDLTDESLLKYNDAVSNAQAKMIVLTFYFE
ncbi:MAG: PorT family protein [Bacteroidaceae bacterium]|nr:PorT family protein [Bacteroidaceae bacterium]MBP9637358.1 PorT family protein [Bacteroidaceae bacterium]